jgi:hypothetical protein
MLLAAQHAAESRQRLNAKTAVFLAECAKKFALIRQSRWKTIWQE